MPTKLVTAPALEPVSVDEAKRHLRVDGLEDNPTIDALITTAREYAENVTWRALITQTCDLFLDRFPAEIVVPKPPLQSVASVKYTDTGGVQQTLAGTEYDVDTRSEPGRIRPAWGKTWPSIRPGMNAVEIRFAAGYGDTPDAVPRGIRQAIELIVAHWYENREPVVLARTAPRTVPKTVDDLLFQYRVWSTS